MLFIFKAVIMGIVEGVTEFLPISSTGHLILTGSLIDFQGEFAKTFEVVIQLGAILAVIFLYFDKILNSLKNLAPKKWGFKLWLNILIAFIPAAVIGLILHKKINLYLFKPATVVAALIVGAFLMIFIENKFRKSNGVRRIEDVSPAQALKIGFFQCLALWPGMSRSASTIMGAWVSGLNTEAAAEFSFFLAIPTMVAATGLELVKSPLPSMTGNEVIALMVGFVVSFAVALIVIDKFINFLKKKPMKYFAYYRIIIGIVFLALSLMGFINMSK